MNRFGRSDAAGFFAETALFNVILALALAALFFLFSLKPKREKLPLCLAVFACLPIVAVLLKGVEPGEDSAAPG